MAEKIHAAGKRRSRSDAISYLCTKKCQCLPNYYSGLLIKEIKSTTNSQFHKSTCKGNSTTLPTKNNNLASQDEEIIASEAAKAASTSTYNGSSHDLMEVQVQGLKQVPKLVSFLPKNQEIAPPDDEHSQTVGPIKAKEKADDNVYYDEALSESSSLYSLHASNNTSNNYEEPARGVVKEKLSRKRTGIKRRRRNAESHNLHEKKRRDEINKKMLMLKDLIPNCNKMDKASMLDDAIEYLKALKCQLQIMSMGVCVPLMMLPTATPPHMMMRYTPHLHHLMGFSSPFTNQIPTMPISHGHGAPIDGDPSIQQPLLAKSSTAIMAENQGSFQLTPHPKKSSSRTSSAECLCSTESSD